MRPSRAAVLALLALAACASTPSSRGPDGQATHPLVGKPAPPVDAAPVAGSERATTRHAGEVVVVDFWSSYCGPCVKEFPQLQALQDRHGGKVHVVGVSEDEEQESIAPFLARTGVKFPIAWDKDKVLGAQYTVGSMPQTFVIDGAGVVRFVHQGYHAGEADELEREVTELLGRLDPAMTRATPPGAARWRAILASAAVALAPACRERRPPPVAESAGASARAPSAPPPAAPLASAPPAPGPRRLFREEHAMGTSVTVQVFAPGDADLPRPAARVLDEAFAEIARLERLMSTWVPESEVSQVNAHAAERPVAVGPDTLRVLVRSRWASEASGGTFDITFEVMHGLWRFDHDLDGAVPDRAQVEQLRARIDFRDVAIDEARGEVRFAHPYTKINLGGIAKGYAIDRMARVLLDAGLRDFVVQAGGDLYAHGKKPDGSPWLVGVRDPRGPPESFFGSLAIDDHAFSTAGDYERSFIKDGKRYHHIIDPRTGYPATASRSVTVWADDAFTADALDDAIFILGPEQGMALCEATPGCGAVMVDANNRVLISRRIAGVFRQNRAPTDGL